MHVLPRVADLRAFLIAQRFDQVLLIFRFALHSSVHINGVSMHTLIEHFAVVIDANEVGLAPVAVEHHHAPLQAFNHRIAARADGQVILIGCRVHTEVKPSLIPCYGIDVHPAGTLGRGLECDVVILHRRIARFIAVLVGLRLVRLNKSAQVDFLGVTVVKAHDCCLAL